MLLRVFFLGSGLRLAFQAEPYEFFSIFQLRSQYERDAREDRRSQVGGRQGEERYVVRCSTGYASLLLVSDI